MSRPRVWRFNTSWLFRGCSPASQERRGTWVVNFAVQLVPAPRNRFRTPPCSCATPPVCPAREAAFSRKKEQWNVCRVQWSMRVDG